MNNNVSPDILIARIDELEAEQNPIQAEKRLSHILSPLLDPEGYKVEHTGGPGDNGVDFLATIKNATPPNDLRIGVQYKHLQSRIGPTDMRQVIGASITNDIDRMLFISRSGFSAAAQALLSRQLPTSIELLDMNALRRWALSLEGPARDETGSAAAAAISDLSAQLARIVARNPDELDHLEWRDLERVVHTIFSKLGFDATLTPSAKDGGRDVILRFSANRENRVFIVEVKHWRCRQRVGKSAVTDFVKVMAAEASGGLFLATYGYSGKAFEAITEVERSSFFAGDQRKIVALCRTFVRAESGLLELPDDKTELITDDADLAI